MTSTDSDPEYRAGLRARARLAAHRRQQPGDDIDQLTEACYAELAATDNGSAYECARSAPAMTAPQADRLRGLWNSKPPISTTASTHSHPDGEKWTRASLRGHLFVNHWDDDPHPHWVNTYRLSDLRRVHDRQHGAGDGQS